MADEPATLPVGRHIIGANTFGEAALGVHGHVNPATGRIQSTIPLGGDHEVDLAVSAARAALPGWRSLGVRERGEVLFRIADLLERRAEELGAIGVLENGLPISFAPFVCGNTPSDWFRYYAGWTDKMAGDCLPSYQENSFDYTTLEPYGVVGIFAA